MKLDAIRKIVAVQAIEQCDSDRVIFSDNDLREASAIAGAPLPKSAGDAELHSFLAERADLLAVRALSRFPEQSSWVDQSADGHRFGILAAVLIAVACALGFLSNELGPDDRINILSFPLLGILAWSLLVSIRELFLIFRNREAVSESSAPWIRSLLPLNHSEQPEGHAKDHPSEWKAARSLYAGRWSSLTFPSLYARLKILLHSVAIALTLSAIAGMYLKGLANEYRAVWESTFFESGASIRPFLNGILGPAATLMGDEFPSAEALDKIHWKAAEEEVAGENAARWIHWYALTLCLFVLLPRSLFALAWRWKDLRSRRTLSYRSISPHYFDHLIAISSGSAREFTLIPYGLEIGESERRTIERGLESFLEGPVDLTYGDPVGFGEEDLKESGGDYSEATLIPLFNFASTPEKETHLELLLALEEKADTPLPFLLLDATDFDRKNEGLGDSAKRREDRENAWRHLLSENPIELVVVSAFDSNPAPHGED